MSLYVSQAIASYGNTNVLHGVDITVRAGAVHAVVGASGCGKTTLLRSVAGLHRLLSGAIHLGDVPWDANSVFVPAHRRRAAMVPQEGALFAQRSVASNIGYGVRGSRAARSRKVQELMEMCGLTPLAHHRPHQLSGGQQQRVALARALAVEPALLLMDEPFSALDATLRSQLRAEVKRVLAQAGTTVMMVTHDMADVVALADDVTLLAQGAVQQSGAVAEVFDAPNSVEVAWAMGGRVSIPAVARGTLAQSEFGDICLAQALTGPCVVLPWRRQLTFTPPSCRRPLVRVMGVRRGAGQWEVDVIGSAGTVLHMTSDRPVTVGESLSITVIGDACAFPAAGSV